MKSIKLLCGVSILVLGTGISDAAFAGQGHSHSGHSYSGHSYSGHSYSGHSHSGYSHSGYSHSGYSHSGYSHSGYSHSDHSHHGAHVGVVIGGPLWWPGPGYYSPYYYDYPYSPIVTVPVEPPVYIEQPQTDILQPGYWYYCNKPDGYYPYVKQCPGGWQRVAPLPSK